MKSLLINIITIISLKIIYSQVVCSEDELVREILEDIMDNNKLDCLLSSENPNNETPEQTRLRKKAEWNSDCSFKSNPNFWLNDFIKEYGLTKGLVDVNGNPMQNLAEDQSDMCQIIRALIANGKFPEIGSDVTKIDTRIIDYINCPGENDQTRVCAATGSSFLNRDDWYILLKGESIKVGDFPTFEISNDTN